MCTSPEGVHADAQLVSRGSLAAGRPGRLLLTLYLRYIFLIENRKSGQLCGSNPRRVSSPRVLLPPCDPQLTLARLSLFCQMVPMQLWLKQQRLNYLKCLWRSPYPANQMWVTVCFSLEFMRKKQRIMHAFHSVLMRGAATLGRSQGG